MYYCDGNFVNNQWCPEYDLQESNTYVFVATLHNCEWGGDWFTSCDRGGCQANSFKIDPSMFCPEDRCTINTQKPFHVSHFQNKQIANVYMSQEGREVHNQHTEAIPRVPLPEQADSQCLHVSRGEGGAQSTHRSHSTCPTSRTSR